MVKKNTQAAAARPDVSKVNRTSEVAMADYIHTLVQHAPERLDGIVDPATVKATEAAIAEAGDRFTSTTDRAIQRAIETKVEAAVRALTNEDELNGYAGRAFNAEVFAKKVAPKTGRRKLSPEERAARTVEQATPEQLDALAELLKARGLA